MASVLTATINELAKNVVELFAVMGEGNIHARNVVETPFALMADGNIHARNAEEMASVLMAK